MKKIEGVAAIILDGNDKILINKRTKNCYWEPNVWSLPCGKVEENEDPREAIIRELKEEFGIDVQIVQKVSERTYFLKNEDADWIVYGYLCQIKNGNLKILEPKLTEEIKFISINQLPENFFPELKTVIEDFQKTS
ncbi:MAG: NUDIX hydrolase [Candidatus Aenigmarchaeota archaeon]|nr:NUDIX hydrolase [Candidatus Aenigmarchaeota archaeon]